MTTSSIIAKNKHLHLAEILRQRITRGELKPGDRLPTLAEMYAEYGLSRSTVERAHALLEQEGTITREQGRGAFVTEKRRRGLIGFIGSIFTTSSQLHYSLYVSEGIRSVLAREEQRIVMLEANSPYGWDKVDGLLLCAPGQIETALVNRPPQLPCVTLLASVPGISSVVADDFVGARQAIEALVALGHRRIACLMEDEGYLPHVRFQGYRAGLQQSGIEPEVNWAWKFSATDDEHYRDWGRQQMQNWIDRGWSNTGCTALLAQNDLAAVGAMEALQAAGFADVSVVGFDSTEVCDYVSPRLSSIEIPLRQIGIEGTELLLRHIDDPSRLTQTITLPTRFVARESVRPIQQS